MKHHRKFYIARFLSVSVSASFVISLAVLITMAIELISPNFIFAQSEANCLALFTQANTLLTADVGTDRTSARAIAAGALTLIESCPQPARADCPVVESAIIILRESSTVEDMAQITSNLQGAKALLGTCIPEGAVQLPPTVTPRPTAIPFPTLAPSATSTQLPTPEINVQNVRDVHLIAEFDAVSMYFDPTGQYLLVQTVVPSRSPETRVFDPRWDVYTLGTYPPAAPLYSLDVDTVWASPNSERLVGYDYDNDTFYIFEMQSGTLITTIEGVSPFLVFHPNGNWIAYSPFDSVRTYIWDIATRAVIHELDGSSPSFSGDGQRLVITRYRTTRDENTVIVYDTTTWEEIFSIEGEEYRGSLTLDGRTLLISSDLSDRESFYVSAINLDTERQNFTAFVDALFPINGSNQFAVAWRLNGGPQYIVDIHTGERGLAFSNLDRVAFNHNGSAYAAQAFRFMQIVDFASGQVIANHPDTQFVDWGADGRSYAIGFDSTITLDNGSQVSGTHFQILGLR